MILTFYFNKISKFRTLSCTLWNPEKNVYLHKNLVFVNVLQINVSMIEIINIYDERKLSVPF